MRCCFVLLIPPSLACNLILGAADTKPSSTESDSSTGDSTTPTTQGSETESETNTASESETESTTEPPTCNMNGQCDLGESPALCPAECANCGNGVIDGDEICDYGMENSPDDAYFDGDAADAPCNSSCTGKVPHCGDTVCQQDDEDSLSCPEDGCLASCGNGVVEDGEECDDDNDVNTDACLNSCKEAVCGDGVVREGVEPCDDANGSNSDSCVGACEMAVCGDGYTWSGMEDCDDANDVETDDCDIACQTVVHRKVFLSSSTSPANLGGLIGADNVCQDLADNVMSLQGRNFQAWLSDGTLGPADRFDTAFTGVYELNDNPATHVARGWTGLIGGELEHAIDADETGDTIVIFQLAMTNTTTVGEPLSLTEHCTNWTSSSGFTAAIGDTTATNSTWTEQATEQACGVAYRLYCFEDPAP